jgi:ADP-heptose:LPS heptosyltransferase
MHAHYDVVVDLQRNTLSRMIRRALRPKSCCEFDRFSLQAAGDRTRKTIDRLGFPQLPESLPQLQTRGHAAECKKLFENHSLPADKLVILNPAGNFATKNWPMEYYVQFARLWLERIDENTRFLLLGLDSMKSKAAFLGQELGSAFRSLAGLTTQAEAFHILQKADLVLTEDSGLMHMAWVSQVPVVALFGSTKSVWSKPLGTFSLCLDSSDLTCGECAQPVCRFGDVHCLTRRTPESIIHTAQQLLAKKHALDSSPQ